ncbi:hypothetical protein L484_017924 [Morus notabilis]|uniref:Uncharacterized protein n=1 Tax=Morus notabilis TaxID=981085 RepID=W9RXZ7_9ROSA|nr:hypothetical protein L484_017924 [Morus notabilis]
MATNKGGKVRGHNQRAHIRIFKNEALRQPGELTDMMVTFLEESRSIKAIIRREGSELGSHTRGTEGHPNLARGLSKGNPRPGGQLLCEEIWVTCGMVTT